MELSKMKVTLITGASGGIGKAFARKLAAEKHNLLLVARSRGKLDVLCKELIEEHHITAQYIALDLITKDADQIIFEETEKRDLTVDCLVNNAGVGSAGDFIDLDLHKELDIISLNISFLTSLTFRYLKQMRERNSGTIINIGSMASFQPTPFQAVYAASKAFVRSFTEALVAENKPFKINILLLCPGLTETNFFQGGEMSIQDKKTLAGNISFQSPEEVVEEGLTALRKHKTSIISGSKNRLLISMGYLFPNSMLSNIMANKFRSHFQPKK
ncbi:SDR family NAD(P)-dependent oxidoreductase [Mucilaginibacter sp. UYCu711]|uniref:SDR family NAD(P)-dependent oxidoreductase n=1 Tax=Mucilaginibacter sp. UYCu711 TaxID=3156339 RepID=UPI003D1F9871